MSTPLTFEFRLDPAETMRASRDLKRRQRFAWLQWAVWPVLVGLAVLYLATGNDWRRLWPLTLVAVSLLLLQGLAFWIQRWQLRRTYRETPSLRGNQIYQFSDAGLTISGGAVTVTLGWDTFVEVTETETFFLFFYSKRCAYYLPKRVAADDSQLHGLRSLLRTSLGIRAKSLRPADVQVSPT